MFPKNNRPNLAGRAGNGAPISGERILHATETNIEINLFGVFGLDTGRLVFSKPVSGSKIKKRTNSNSARVRLNPPGGLTLKLGESSVQSERRSRTQTQTESGQIQTEDSYNKLTENHVKSTGRSYTQTQTARPIREGGVTLKLRQSQVQPTGRGHTQTPRESGPLQTEASRSNPERENQIQSKRRSRTQIQTESGPILREGPRSTSERARSDPNGGGRTQIQTESGPIQTEGSHSNSERVTGRRHAQTEIVRYNPNGGVALKLREGGVQSRRKSRTKT